mgnify:CR=1 FL=1
MESQPQDCGIASVLAREHVCWQYLSTKPEKLLEMEGPRMEIRYETPNCICLFLFGLIYKSVPGRPIRNGPCVQIYPEVPHDQLLGLGWLVWPGLTGCMDGWLAGPRFLNQFWLQSAHF